GAATPAQRADRHPRRQAHREHAPLRRIRRGTRPVRHASSCARVEPGRRRGHGRASRGTRPPLHRALSMAERARTLGALLDDLARAQPGAEAVVSRDDRLPYAALRARVDDVARALLALGVRRGDRVAVLLPNRPEWLISALAIAGIGGIVTALSTYSTPRE